MTFNVTPEVLLDLLNHVSLGMRKKQRKLLQVTLSAGKRQVSIIGNGMVAAVSIPVRGQGQCQLGWKTITDILATFSASTPVLIECKDNRLQIKSFTMEVQDYKPEAVPKDQPIPTGPEPERSLSTKPAKRESATDFPTRPVAADGYSLLPPLRDATDFTGKTGYISSNDNTGAKEPVVCPDCQSVGYFKKYALKKGDLVFTRQRSWAVAEIAQTLVVLRGDEETRLCPRCLFKRLQLTKHIDLVVGEQIDMYEKENPELERDSKSRPNTDH